MKLFKKLMAGAMAIAMLSAYTVALATGGSESTVSGAKSSEVTLHGNFGGSEVFLMKMPTAAANASLSFTVDPKESIHNSPPTNAITTGNVSTFGTVVFSTQSGSTSPNMIYTNTSKPLQVISMCSTDVTVNMIATLSDTKMKFSTSSGFTGDDAQSHLYLGVQVATLSGGTPTPVSAASGGLQPVTELGAMQATTLKTVAGNFVTIMSGGVNNTVVSGYAAGTKDNAAAAADIPDSQWTGVQYTVIGCSNPNADWQIKNLSAPELKIKWVVDTSNDVTYDPNLIVAATAPYEAKLDKATYKAGETATIYVKPKDAEAKLTNVTLNYIGLNAQEKMTTEANRKFSVQATKVNGVYSATLQWPTDMARPESEKGDITTYAKPTWEIEVG